MAYTITNLRQRIERVNKIWDLELSVEKNYNYWKLELFGERVGFGSAKKLSDHIDVIIDTLRIMEHRKTT